MVCFQRRENYNSRQLQPGGDSPLPGSQLQGSHQYLSSRAAASGDGRPLLKVWGVALHRTRNPCRALHGTKSYDAVRATLSPCKHLNLISNDADSEQHARLHACTALRRHGNQLAVSQPVQEEGDQVQDTTGQHQSGRRPAEGETCRLSRPFH